MIGSIWEFASSKILGNSMILQGLNSESKFSCLHKLTDWKEGLDISLQESYYDRIESFILSQVLIQRSS